MAIIDTFAPTFLDRSASLVRQVTSLFSSSERVEDDSPVAHSEFVQDMISRNADYFSSEYDVQAMMSYYPREF